MKYMLDTNICIFVIRHQKKSVIEKITQHAPADIVISSITVSELEYGCEKSAAPQKNRIALMEFLSPFDVALFGSAAAHRYGMLRAQLERDGKPTGAMDMLIAAHCLAIDATLVTNNTRDFKHINDLSLTDWI